jgi:pantetheine-phosphate adenylyltransferase
MSSKKRIGLFPGSFDPYTKGHEAVMKKALSLFDEIIIGVGINSSKQSYFTLENRLAHIQELYKDETRVRIQTYQKLTVEFAREIGASYIIRGLRDSKDFSYEKPIAHMNFEISSQEVETVFFLTEQRYAAINSSIVREIHRNKADIEAFVRQSNLLK